MRRLCPQRADEGFTLIELMVSLALLLIISLPLTGVFYATLRTASAANLRTDAVGIGVQQVEALHAVPYELLGFYPDQTTPAPSTTWSGTKDGSGAALSGYPTVTLSGCTVPSGTCTSPATPTVLPESTTTLANVAYLIDRYVYWRDFSAVDTQAYKGVSVVVTWRDRTGNHKIEQDSLIYPGGLGKWSGPGSTMTTPTPALEPTAPGAPTVTASTTTTSSEIDVTITPASANPCPSCYYYVQHATSATFAGAVQSPPVYQTTFAAQGLAPNTTYYFRAVTVNNVGQSPYSNSTSGTTLPASSTACTLVALHLTTSTTKSAYKTYLDQNGKMSEDVNLSLSTSGTCSGTFTVISVLDGTSIQDPSSPYSMTASASTYTGSIAATGVKWSVGTHDMTAYVNGVQSSPVVTQGLLVCAATKSPSSAAGTC